MRVRLFFEFDADDVNDAGIELAEYFAGNYNGKNTVGFQTSVEEASELVEELLDENARSSDLDQIFDEFNVSVSKVEIQAYNRIAKRNSNFKESRKSYRRDLREESGDYECQFYVEYEVDGEPDTSYEVAFDKDQAAAIVERDHPGAVIKHVTYLGHI